ncbi:MAG: hypothetical protein WAQ27_02780 [Candidatus Microsaccharimonas sp.]
MAFESHKQYQEAGTHSTGNSLNPIMAVRRDANTSAVATGQYEPLYTDPIGRLKVSAQNGAFDAVTGTITASTQTVAADVTRAGSATIFISGTYATGLTLTFEVTADGTNWVTVLAQPTNAQTIGTTSGGLTANNVIAWDISPLLGVTQLRARASAWASPSGTANIRIVPAVQSPELAPVAAISSGTVTTVSTVTTLSTLTGSGIASGTADSSNPHKIGGQARTTNPTAVADAARVNFIGDKLGKQVVVGSIRELKVQQQTTITSSTAETTILAAVASTFLDVYGLIISNTSATVCSVAIKDATAGTTRFNVSVLPGDTFTFMVPESAAHSQAVVNNNWTATCSASVASITITALAIKNT